MGPGVLNPAGERDSRAFGQRGGVKIDLEVGQLPADARIEGAVGLGLRERQARRGDRTGEQCGERAAIDDHDCSSLSKLVSRNLTPGRQAAQATCEAISISRYGSPDGAQRNPGSASRILRPFPDYA